MLLEPMVIARLMQLTAVRAGERALVVAAGTGYGAAVLAACGARVTALEDCAPLIAIARTRWRISPLRVSMVSGPLAAGWPAGAPYDIILIEGTVAEIPPAIGDQLHRETAPVAICAASDFGGQAVLAEATARAAQPADVRLRHGPIPGLQPSPGFVF